MPSINRIHPASRPARAAVAAVALAAFVTACGAAAAPTQAPSVSPSAAARTPDVTAAPPSASASASAEATRPSAPRGVVFKVKRDVEVTQGDHATLMTRYTVTWESPLDPETTMRVYGVEGCPVEPSTEPEPCVTRRTELPPDMRSLIAKAPAADGSLSWEWPEADIDGLAIAWDGEHGFYAFVMRATNAAGASRFVVLESGTTCPDCGF